MPAILPKRVDLLRKKQRVMQTVRPSRKDHISYYQALLKLNLQMISSFNRINALIEAGISPVIISQEIEKEYEKQIKRYSISAPIIAAAFVTALNIFNKNEVEKKVAKAVRVRPHEVNIIDDQSIDEFLQMSILENVKLIKSIPTAYYNDIADAVYKNFKGMPLPNGSTLDERVEEVAGITNRKAYFIARDQTAKVNAQLTQRRHEEVGIVKYIWRNAQDQRVVGNPSGLYPKGNREHGDHWHREGEVFYYNKPPHDGNPGIPYNCRCLAQGVIDLDEVRVIYSKNEPKRRFSLQNQ